MQSNNVASGLFIEASGDCGIILTSSLWKLMTPEWPLKIRSSATAEGPRDAPYQLKSCHSYMKKIHFEKLAVGEWTWRSLKVLKVIEIASIYISLPVKRSVVTTTLSCSVSEIVPRLHGSWMVVTLRSPPFSKRLFKLHVK